MTFTRTPLAPRGPCHAPGATTVILRSLGLKDTEFALDRGFYSNANVRDLLLGGHHFTMGVLLHCTQSMRLLARYRGALNSPKRSICLEGKNLRHIRAEWTVNMGRRGRGKRRLERTVDAHLFFDPRHHADRVAALDERVLALENQVAWESFNDLGEVKRWLAGNARQVASCLGAHRQPDGQFVLRRRPRASAAEFFAEMGKIRAIRLADGTRLLRDVSKRQRDWLADVGLPPPQL